MKTNERTNEATAMPWCKRPGCVAQSVDGELCAIHAADLGKHCETCGGSGLLWRGDKMYPCDRCGGVGLKDAKVSKRGGKTADDVDERGLIVLAEDDDAR